MSVISDSYLLRFNNEEYIVTSSQREYFQNRISELQCEFEVQIGNRVWKSTKYSVLKLLMTYSRDTVAYKIACILYDNGLNNLEVWSSLLRSLQPIGASLYEYVYTEEDLFTCYMVEHEKNCARVQYLYGKYKQYWNENNNTLTYNNKTYNKVNTLYDVARIGNIYEKLSFADYKANVINEHWIFVKGYAIRFERTYVQKNLVKYDGE